MTPCWWMPASWAKALRPTIALLGCGNTPVTCDSRRLVRYSSRVSTLQRNDASCGRTWLAITISSSAALPARSPIPLTVHSTCPAPPATVGGGEAQIVMTVRRERDPGGSGDALADGAEDLRVLRREREAHGVRQVHGRGALGDRRLHDTAQVLEVGAAGVFVRELDVVGVAAGPAHGGAGQLEAIVPSDLQLVLQVDVGRRNEDV